MRASKGDDRIQKKRDGERTANVDRRLAHML
jgi:hypothetical protein